MWFRGSNSHNHLSLARLPVGNIRYALIFHKRIRTQSA